MKLSFALALIAACPAWSFLAPPQVLPGVSSRILLAAKKEIPDLNELVENAIKEAQGRSEGDALSKEYAVYWDIVEELEAADSHARAAAKKAFEPPKVVEELVAPAEPTANKDNSEAIKMALEASEMYGKTSVQARIAWELVEEIDAANSHHRPEDVHVQKMKKVVVTNNNKEEEEESTKKSGVKPLPTTVEEAIEAATLASKIYGKHSVDARMAWDLVEEMNAASSHLRDSQKAPPAPVEEEEKPVVQQKFSTINIQDTTEAIKAAMEASKTFGKTSVEARMAWETVEEMDAANAHHKSVGTG